MTVPGRSVVPRNGQRMELGQLTPTCDCSPVEDTEYDPSPIFE